MVSLVPFEPAILPQLVAWKNNDCSEVTLVTWSARTFSGRHELNQRNLIVSGTAEGTERTKQPSDHSAFPLTIQKEELRSND